MAAWQERRDGEVSNALLEVSSYEGRRVEAQAGHLGICGLPEVDTQPPVADNLQQHKQAFS